MSDVTVRDATSADAIEIAAVQIASWRTTYTGLVSPEIVAEHTQIVPRLEIWQRWLADPERCTVIALVGGVTCAFSAFGAMPERPQGSEPLPEFDAYLQSLYALVAVQRRGIGRALLAATASRLRTTGYRSLALHVLATNPARGFYERLGAEWVRDEPPDPGASWHGCVYGWRDLATLEARAAAPL
jgi:ribosomal protein S18 acetylase RimI-like enzyme